MCSPQISVGHGAWGCSLAEAAGVVLPPLLGVPSHRQWDLPQLGSTISPSPQSCPEGTRPGVQGLNPHSHTELLLPEATAALAVQHPQPQPKSRQHGQGQDSLYPSQAQLVEWGRVIARCYNSSVLHVSVSLELQHHGQCCHFLLHAGKRTCLPIPTPGGVEWGWVPA